MTRPSRSRITWPARGGAIRPSRQGLRSVRQPAPKGSPPSITTPNMTTPSSPRSTPCSTRSLQALSARARAKQSISTRSPCRLPGRALEEPRSSQGKPSGTEKEEIEMAGYLIANISVRDSKGFEEYRKQVAPLIARFKGRYLVRGGELRTLEGNSN